MAETDTQAPEAEEIVRYLSPPEYVKAANKRDHRVRHAVDLEHFITWLQTNPGLMREIPAENIPTLVEDYLTEVEPMEVVTV